MAGLKILPAADCRYNAEKFQALSRPKGQKDKGTQSQELLVNLHTPCAKTLLQIEDLQSIFSHKGADSLGVPHTLHIGGSPVKPVSARRAPHPEPTRSSGLG